MLKNQENIVDNEYKSPFIEKVREHVLELFNERSNPALVYHSYAQSCALSKIVDTLVIEQEETIKETALIAAYFYNTGYLYYPQTAQQQSAKLLTTFLNDQHYFPDKTQLASQALNSFATDSFPTDTTSKVLFDAINAYTFGENFEMLSAYRHLEKELLNNTKIDKFEWAKLQLQELMQVRFYTHYAKIYYQPIVAQNILQQKEAIEKSKQSGKENIGIQRKYAEIERKIPMRAIQTYFRTNYRNHINLSAIADNKANIMISVNAILLSVLISLLTYKDMANTKPMVVMSLAIFLVTGLTSLIFAVLSSRPKVTSLHQNGVTLEQAKQNIVFFGNFVTLSLAQYEEAMDSMFKNGELLYGNLVRDLYFLGKVLDKKYRYLTISYNIFMIGFAATVITFLITMLLA